MFRSNPIGFVLTLILCLVVVGIPILITWWLKSRATLLTITDERTILRRGIFSKSISEDWHTDVRNVQLYQTFFQRIFDVGQLSVSSAGQSGVELDIIGIPDPDGAKDLIDGQKRASTRS